MKQDSNAAQSLGVEQAIHGAAWGRMHGGYFSDAQVEHRLERSRAHCPRSAGIRPAGDSPELETGGNGA